MDKVSKIVIATKAVTLTVLLLVVLFAKENFDTVVISNQVEQTLHESEEKKSNDEVKIISFEATISFFAIDFLDLSHLFIHKITVNFLELKPVISTDVIFTLNYFRILFSRILPINAP